MTATKIHSVSYNQKL